MGISLNSNSQQAQATTILRLRMWMSWVEVCERSFAAEVGQSLIVATEATGEVQGDSHGILWIVQDSDCAMVPMSALT